MFANDSASSMCSATVTPSFVTSGEPCIGRSSRMFRPAGPRVGFTALTRMRAPTSRRARASSPNKNLFDGAFN